MKTYILFSLLFSTSAFSQDIDLNSYKSIMTSRQATLENVYPGMTKKIVSMTKFPTSKGFCVVTETAVQTVLKIEDQKSIIHSKENYLPAQTSSCEGFEAQDISVLFYEAKPTLAQDLSDLDATAPDITTISRDGEIVTMNLKPSVTVRYDLTRPGFKNLILMKDSNLLTEGFDMADTDVNSIDLKNVLFCDSADSENCSQGDWSDILF